jgi:RNA polymerase sigma-70 factor (sigma-E family)
VETDFEQYVAARAAALLRLAHVLAGDPHEAEDVVQEVLVRAHRRWARVAAADDPHAYVRRMVVNEHLSRRRRRVLDLLTPAGRVPERAAPGVGDHGLPDRDLVWRLMAALPARQRAVLVLRYYEDLPDHEVAAVLGVAPGTVRSLAARAFARLREHPGLAHYGLPHSERPAPVRPRPCTEETP